MTPTDRCPTCDRPKAEAQYILNRSHEGLPNEHRFCPDPFHGTGRAPEQTEGEAKPETVNPNAVVEPKFDFECERPDCGRTYKHRHTDPAPEPQLEGDSSRKFELVLLDAIKRAYYIAGEDPKKQPNQNWFMEWLRPVIASHKAGLAAATQSGAIEELERLERLAGIGGYIDSSEVEARLKALRRTK